MPSHLDALLSIENTVLDAKWQVLLAWLEDHFGRQAGIESILFLIGIQSQGTGYQPKLSKKKKQALIMEGTHCAFETLGLYKRVGMDANGQIVWERTDIPLQKLPLPEQEKLLRVAILSYFDKLQNG